MKVLHVYSHDNPRLAKYAALLSQAMPADVECAFADTPSDVRRAVKDFKPDIIHQHGHAIAYAQTRARLVVTPHGENIDTQRAYVVIARSPYERSTYERQAPKSESQIQGHKAKRTVLVQNPLITRTISFDVAAEAIAAIYRRIMDSHPLELMNDETRLLLAAALKAGLLGDKRWVDAQCTMHNAQCSMLNAQCTMHNLQFSIFNFQSSIFTIFSSMPSWRECLTLCCAA